MKIGKLFSGVLVLLMVLSFIGSVSAITGSIGNARMILRVETGDKIDKYILVKNMNDVPLEIELSADGDLAGYIDIKDDKFTLNAGGQKKAYFEIEAKKEGTTETKINIMFTPEDGNGVGLSSTIIVIAKGEGEWDDENGVDERGDGVSVTPGNVIDDFTEGKPSKIKVLLSVTFAVLLIFFLVLILLFRKTKQGIEVEKDAGAKKKRVASKPKKSSRKK
jgi:hypothetical protein